jgi:hypothetical protein
MKNNKIKLTYILTWLAVAGLASVKQHDTAKDLRLSPVSHHVGGSIRILLKIPILCMKEEARQSATWIVSVENCIICWGYPCDKFMVIA